MTRNVMLAGIAAAVVWMLVTPFYNLFLTKAAERLTRLGERPPVTRIELSHGQDGLISRADSRVRGLPYAVRVTDIHFPLVLLFALFLGTPDVDRRERLEALGYALLITVCFDVVDLFFWVKFVYATQLGSWSLRHYGPLARNFWGLGKHLLDLPVKLALPFALWAAFYLRRLTGEPAVEPA
ncbi:MAG TPA: hypothetical protein VGV61_19395 [Thermoanaerobaculia bacterium]|nr:hypothetical protein [Thermoanaerobaculia bacterium]